MQHQLLYRLFKLPENQAIDIDIGLEDLYYSEKTDTLNSEIKSHISVLQVMMRYSW